MKKLFITLMIAFTAMSSFAAISTDVKLDITNETFPYKYSSTWGDSEIHQWFVYSPFYTYVMFFNIQLSKNDTLNITYDGIDKSSSNIGSIGDVGVNSRSYSYIASEAGDKLISIYSANNPDSNAVKTSFSITMDLHKVKGSGVHEYTKTQISISSCNSIVLIAGTQEKATIYSIGGAKVYEGADREIALPSGIYVVRIGEMAKKVIVK